MSLWKKSVRKSQNRRTKNGPLVESYSCLEPRNMLSITLVDGIVEIEGTLNDDTVTVEPRQAGAAIVVTLNDDEQTFQVEDITRVRFRGLQGDDTFTNTSDVDSTAFGHAGNDVFIGGGGHNRFQGGDGRDELTGGPRNDVLRGRDGNDIINGEQRHDRLFGGNGQDEINGGQGRDFINGGAGDDTLTGGNLEDRIFGEGGDDEIIGGTDNDRLVGGGGNDNINGGDGIDVIIGNVGDDSLSGGDGADEIRGGEGNDRISGDDGNDLLNGLEGNDTILGGAGLDTVDAGDGDDQVFGGIGPDVINGGLGNDELFGNENVDTINGGEGNDRIYGGEDTANILNGDAGTDLIVSSANADSITDSEDDIVVSFTSVDATPGGIWSAKQIEDVTLLLTEIVERADNVAIIGDSVAGNAGSRVQFIKGTDLEAENLRENGALSIQIPDWDPSDSVQANDTQRAVARQIGRLWADVGTVEEVFGAVSSEFVTRFYSVSDWTEGTDVPDGFIASTDGEWYYDENAEFFTDLGRENPSADWANLWEFTFSEFTNLLDVARLSPKTTVLDSFFESL